MFLISTLTRLALGPRPRLVVAKTVWRGGVAELRRRANGRRESGAFLLGRLSPNGIRRITEFLFYDDIDPTCFRHGIVEFDGRKFGDVWKHCRRRNVTVVADVHVHPGGFGQSPSDRHNPMIAEVGHLALILPHYAAAKTVPPGIGVYEYLGSRHWRNHSPSGSALFHVGWWPA
jgi:hypothetical protein